MRAHSKCVALRTSLLCLNPPFSHHSVCVCTQSWPTLCNPMGCSLLGSSVHGILQARAPEWVVISFSRGSSRPRDRTPTISQLYLNKKQINKHRWRIRAIEHRRKKCANHRNNFNCDFNRTLAQGLRAAEQEGSVFSDTVLVIRKKEAF